MSTLGSLRVWLWLAVAVMLLFCFGPFAVAQTNQKWPSSKPQQNSASDPHASPAGQQGTPSPHVIGEDQDFIRQREAWFYGDRSLPDGTIPAALRLRALQQLDEMIEVEKKMGLIPDSPVPSSIDFLGPTSWTSIGPQGILVQPGNPFSGNPLNAGRVTSIAVNPFNKNVVYMGAAAGGVWKSTDGGAHWTVLTDTQPSLSVGSLAIDPSSCIADCSTIYVGTGEANNSGDSYYGAGVLKSTNGGATWTQTGTPPGSPFVGPFSDSRLNGGAHISAIAVDPNPPVPGQPVVLAGAQFLTSAANSGLYRSDDGGTTWARVLSGAPATSIVFDPSRIVYVALGSAGGGALNGVYRSAHPYTTWTRLAGFPTTGVGRIALAVAPGGTTVYAAVANSDGSTFLGVFKTIDSGANWPLVSNTDICSNLPLPGGQCAYDLAIAVDPASTNVLFAGGSSGPEASRALFRSTDFGATWASVRPAGATPTVNLHVDLHALAFSADGSRLYIGNDGGMWRTDNPAVVPGTPDYVNLNATLTITMFYPGFAVHQADENIGFGGTQDTGTERFTGGLTWQSVTGGDGGFAAIDPRIPSVVYTSCQFICIFRSLRDGDVLPTTTFFSRTSGINPADRNQMRFIAPLVHDPTTAGRVYFGTFRVYLTTDFAETWTAISPDLTGGSGAITAIAPARSEPNVVYVGTGSTASGLVLPGKIQKTTNALAGTGATWADITNSTVLPTNRSVSAIAVDKNDASLVYATFTGFSNCTGCLDTKGHVFRSASGGTTWEDISGTGAAAIPNVPANDIVADPDAANTLYVATDIGVFTTSNANAGSATTWLPMVGLPRVVVLGLTLRRQSRILRAVTSGRGVFIIQLTNIPIPPGPLLASMNPSSKPAGFATSFTLSLAGANFTTGSRVRWNGSQTGVTTILPPPDPNHLTAAVDASLLRNPGMADVSVTDPAGTSDNLRFSVLSAPPSVTSLVPPSTATGGLAFTLTVNGTNFNCSGGSGNSVLLFRGVAHAPTQANCTSTQMNVDIAASEIATSGNGNLRVFTPPPGGGDSDTVSFPITAPRPVNDDFASAMNAGPTPFTDTRDTSGATSETGEPVPPANCATGQTTTATHSIWYKFTAPTNGIITADTQGSLLTDGIHQYDTILQAGIAPNGLPSFSLVACNGDVNLNPPFDLTSKVTFGATAGTQYFFMVSGFLANDFGTAVFHLSFTPSDFTVSGPSGAVTVNAGQPATFTITVSPTAAGFPQAVTFFASPLPAATTAAFSPTPVTPGNTPATTTLTITTTARSLVPRLTPHPPRPVVLLWLLAGLLGLASIALLRRGFRTRRLALYLPLALLALSAASIVGCGGAGGGVGGGGTPPPPGGTNGTPAGTYTITVTATSGGLSHTTTVTLVVN